MRDRKVRMVFAASLAALCAQPVWQARAQEAGKAEVRILVGFPAGGTVDAIARVVADKLKNAAGGPVLIENKPGAAGLVATKALLASPPDGTVPLLAGVSAVAIEPIIRPREQFDPTRDLAPITLATRSEYGLAVSNALNVRNLQELVQWARANPSKAAFGSPGAGSPPHLFGALFVGSAEIDMLHVPFKGGGPLITDLIGGHIPAGVSPVTDFIEHHRNGKLRLLATSGARRSASTPDVATFVEQGFKEAQAALWFAFWAPAETPATIITRRNREIVEVLQMLDVRERLLKLGQEPISSTPEELARLTASEMAKWAPLVKASGFIADQ